MSKPRKMSNPGNHAGPSEPDGDWATEPGAIITTMDQIVSELAIDWTTPNGQKLSGILAFH